jgi:hypothetical protein
MFIGIRMLPCMSPRWTDILELPPRRLGFAPDRPQSDSPFWPPRPLVHEPRGGPVWQFLSNFRMRGQRQSDAPQEVPEDGVRSLRLLSVDGIETSRIWGAGRWIGQLPCLHIQFAQCSDRTLPEVD